MRTIIEFIRFVFETVCKDRSKESAVNGFFTGKVAFGSPVILNLNKLIRRF